MYKSVLGKINKLQKKSTNNWISYKLNNRILCTTYISVDGIWSSWTAWNDCDSTCGGGRQSRNRTCTEPAPQYGGDYCSGNDTDVSTCNDNLCPGKM